MGRSCKLLLRGRARGILRPTFPRIKSLNYGIGAVHILKLSAESNMAYTLPSSSPGRVKRPSRVQSTMPSVHARARHGGYSTPRFQERLKGAAPPKHWPTRSSPCPVMTCSTTCTLAWSRDRLTPHGNFALVSTSHCTNVRDPAGAMYTARAAAHAQTAATFVNMDAIFPARTMTSH